MGRYPWANDRSQGSAEEDADDTADDAEGESTDDAQDTSGA
ncbi:hypothetical protein [Amycolatopsis sp. 195334CR]|nr:hypothetical protein [Amycolatopsis sp. 195334CR]